MLRPFLRVVPNGSGQRSSGATGAAGSEATYNSRPACLKNAVAFALFRSEVPCGLWGLTAARMEDQCRTAAEKEVAMRLHQLKQHGDPWRLSDDLPPPGKGHSTR